MTKKRETRVFKIDKSNPGESEEILENAAETVRRGGLVCFPTETVYGLGADACNDSAVTDIFRAKNRSFENPIALHLHSVDEIEKYAVEINHRAKLLMEKFLPGPLMMLFIKNERVSNIVTGGFRKVGIRIPRHEMCLKFLEKCGTPVAATSANESGRLACVQSSDIMEELNGKFDILLDMGKSPIGIESTVLDVTTDPPRIIRPGFITMEEIAMTIGIPPIFSDNVVKQSSEEPSEENEKTRLLVIEGPLEFFQEQVELQLKKKERVGLALTNETAELYKDYPYHKKIGSELDPVEVAHNIFEVIRDLERKSLELIIIEGIPRKGLGRTLMIKLCGMAEECIKPEDQISI